MELPIAVLNTASDGRWRPGIGDPSWDGWLTVAAYLVAAALAALACRASWSDVRGFERARPEGRRQERLLTWFWLLVAVTLTALAINKQLDLQSLFTQVLRDQAHAGGWYADRRRYQFAFVVTIACGGVLGVGAIAWIWRRVLDRVWMALLGVGWLTSFVVIRAASFHHVETWLTSLTPVGNAALELSGIALVAVGAGRVLRPGETHPARRSRRPNRREPADRQERSRNHASLKCWRIRCTMRSAAWPSPYGLRAEAIWS
jgi:hypothetical protein